MVWRAHHRTPCVLAAAVERLADLAVDSDDGNETPVREANADIPWCQAM